MPFLRPLGLPRPQTLRHFLRFSTTSICREQAHASKALPEGERERFCDHGLFPLTVRVFQIQILSRPAQHQTPILHALSNHFHDQENQRPRTVPLRMERDDVVRSLQSRRECVVFGISGAR